MSRDDKRIKWLARSGEKFFENACIDAGMTPSPPQYDENGWDFFVELPANRVPNIYLDAQPAAIKALCQIKSTDKIENMSLSMKISNFDHLARTPLPSFVIVIDYLGSNYPKNIFVCHFNQERIGQTLERIRRLQMQGKTQINQHDMLLKIEHSEKIELNSQDWALREIIKYTGLDLSAYTRRKSDLINTLGYGKGRYQFSIHGKIPLNQLVDAHLGLGKIEISGGTISSIRFDLAIPEEQVGSGSITINAEPQGECRISAISRKKKLKADVLGRVFLPNIPNLPSNYIKTRIVWLFSEIIIQNNSGTAKFKVDPDAPCDLDEAISSLKFIITSAIPDSKINIYKDLKNFGSMDLDFGDTMDPFYPYLLARLEILRDFLDYSGNRGKFLVTIGSLLQQEEALKIMNIAVNRGKYLITAEAPPGMPPQQSNAKGTFACGFLFKLNDQFIIAFCIWDAKFKLDSSIRATVRKGHICDFALLETVDEDTIGKLSDEFRATCQPKGSDVLLFREIDLDDFSK